MRVAVVGATGLVGKATEAALRVAGHDVVAIARSQGVDVIEGTGLDAAIEGVDAVIDVTNTPATDAAAAEEFFRTVSANLLAAEQRAEVRHHIVLSIVGIERVANNAHYAGKRRQEQVVEAGSVPYTIQRATQFFEFAGMVVQWTTINGIATVAPLLMQPVAVSDVGSVLTELAAATPIGRAPDLAGPEQQDLVDMARRTLAARRDPTRLRVSWRGPFSVEMAGEVLLPGPDARIASTTFDDWLAAIAR